MTKTQTKSKQRVADHGEVFTAEREVNATLDLVKQETEKTAVYSLEPVNRRRVYHYRSVIFFQIMVL